MFQAPEFSSEYRWATSMANPHWRLIRRITMMVTLGRCCVLPILPAHHADHLGYRNLGRELPFRDLVPLNRYVHEFVTVARRGGLKIPVNLVLRLCYGAWLALWVTLAITILHLLHVVSLDPLPAVGHALATATTFLRGSVLQIADATHI